MERDPRGEDRSAGVTLSVQLPDALERNFHVTAPSTRTEASLVLAVLDDGGCGACVIDANGTPLLYNTSFHRLFGVSGGRSATASHTGLSRSAVGRLLRQVSGGQQWTVVSEVEAADRQSRRMLIRCLPANHVSINDGVRMLLAIEIGRCMAPSIAVLQQVFGLTPAEARIAACIGAGHDVKQAAASSNVSIGTARAYLKAIFEKTHTHRQAELTAVLGRLSFIGSHAAGSEPRSTR